MTKYSSERAKAKAELGEMLASGKPLEKYYKYNGICVDKWDEFEVDVHSINNLIELLMERCLRVKPEPCQEKTWQPYKKVERWMMDKIIRPKNADREFSIIGIDYENNQVAIISGEIEVGQLFKYWTWSDGSSIGELR